eukprot:comp21073_c0_seq2/m.44388 comp21073_c0_seq2/g.44388  ORF comp21073_c0_seq2/g.44388 comp21073_c0_seq2/m.44388 type:complete len:353 (+) comp21073_c0_seq2:192-1250(+)
MMMRGVWVIGGVVLVGVCVAVVAALQIGSAKTARKKRRFPWDETVELSQTVEMLRVFLDRAAHRFSSEQMGNLTALLMKCTQPSGRESNTALEIAIIEVVKQCVTDAMPEYDGADHIENPAEPIASTPATRRGAADPSAERALLGTAARFDFDPEWLDFLHSHGFARIAKIVPQILMTHALTRFDNLCAGRALCPPGFRILRRAADQQTQETHENLENHQKVENQLHIAKFASACGLASDPHFAEIFKHIPRPPLATSVLGSRLLVGLDGSRPAAWSCNMVLLAALTPAPSLRLSIAVPDPARQRAEISFPLDAGDVLVLRHPLCRFRTQQENEVFLEIEMAAEEWSEAESS